MTNPLQAAAVALAATMVAFNETMPAIGGRPTPRFERVVDYDGLGRKKKAKQHPLHGPMRSRSYAEFRARVIATHRVNPDTGEWQEDPRDDKYLHAGARGFRGLRKALAA